MSAALQEFVKNDQGFGQYTERYEEVSSDLAVRRQFAAWSAEMDKLDIVRAIGEAEGEKKKAVDAARKLLSSGVDPDIIAKCVDLTLEEVLELGK